MMYVNRLRGVHRDPGRFWTQKNAPDRIVKDESIPLRGTTLLHPSLTGAGLTGYWHTLAL